MGFGLICAGYSTLLFLRLVPVEFFGFIFVLKGLGKLCSFNKFFALAKKSVYPILAYSLADCVYWILNRLNIVSSVLADNIFTYLHSLVLLPFYFLLFMALRDISNEVGYPKGMKRASLAISSAIVYYLVFALSRIGIAGIDQYFIVAEYIFYIILFLVTESAVYTCYRAITTDEAEKREEEELKKFEERFGRKSKDKKQPSDTSVKKK